MNYIKEMRGKRVSNKYILKVNTKGKWRIKNKFPSLTDVAKDIGRTYRTCWNIYKNKAGVSLSDKYKIILI